MSTGNAEIFFRDVRNAPSGLPVSLYQVMFGVMSPKI